MGNSKIKNWFKYLLLLFFFSYLLISTGCSRLEELLKIEPVIDGPVAITNYSYMRKLGKTELVWDNPADTSVSTLTVNRSLSEITYSNEMFFSDSEINLVTTITELIPSSTIRVMDENTDDDKSYFYTVSSLDLNKNLLAYVNFKTSIDKSAPSVITNLTSRRINDENVVLNWENPKDIDFDYVVIRRSSIENGVEGSEVYATTNLEVFLDTDSDSSEGYFYGFQSVDIFGNASDVLIIEILDYMAPPDKVSELNMERWYKQNSFTWKNPIDWDFSHVVIKRSLTKEGLEDSPILLTTSETSFIDELIDNDTSYYYGFYSVDKIGNSSKVAYLFADINGEVAFPDTSFLKLIRDTTGIFYAPIYKEDLYDIEVIDGYFNQIFDIRGVEWFENLINLDLNYNEITDISGLASLTNLQILMLKWNNIIDISALSFLTNLQTLDLHDNDITDISTLSSLTSLRTLDLGYNYITDISALSSLTNLQTLELNGNEITDVSGLASFTNLQTLNLASNEITDISAFFSLTSLQTLYLDWNEITNIVPLFSLTNLQTLSISTNDITNISALSFLTNLQTLNLKWNKITDISSVSSLTNLKILRLDYNQISDVSSLVSLTNLTDLYLCGNPISSEDIFWLKLQLPNTTIRF